MQSLEKFMRGGLGWHIDFNSYMTKVGDCYHGLRATCKEYPSALHAAIL